MSEIEPTPGAGERRRYWRLHLPKVRVQLHGTDGWRDEFLQDFSVGGVFLCSRRTLPAGSTIELRVLDPDNSEPLTIQGRVSRIEQGTRDSDSGMAIEFIELGERETERLSELVEHFPAPEGVRSAPGMEDEPREFVLEVPEILEEESSMEEELKKVQTELALTRERLESSENELAHAREELENAASGERRGEAAAVYDELRAELEELRERLRAALGSRSELESLLRDERQRRVEAEEEGTRLREQLAEGSTTSDRSGLESRIQTLTAELLRARELARTWEVRATDAMRKLDEAVAAASGEEVSGSFPRLSAERPAAHEVSESASDGEPMSESEPEQPADDDDGSQTDADLEESDEAPEPLLVDQEADPEDDTAQLPTLNPDGTLAASPEREPEPEPASTPASEPESESLPDQELEEAAREAAASEPDAAVLCGDDEATLGPEQVPTVEAFREHLMGGSKVRLTQRFERLEPVSRADIQVSDWLRESQGLEGILRLSEGLMKEDQVVRVLHLFFQRDLIRITP